MLFKPMPQFLVSFLEGAHRQALSRLAVSTRVLVRNRAMASRGPRLDPTHRLPAGTSPIEHLPEKRDECYPRGVDAPPLLRLGHEDLRGNESSHERGKTIQTVGLPLQFLGLRPAAAQQMRKPGQI